MGMQTISLLPIYRWFEHSWMGVGVRSESYIFPIVECIHLLGMICLLGTIIVVDLRLLGVGLRQQSVSKVASTLAPVTWFGLATMLITGVLLFSSEAMRCYANVAFSYKMVFLFLAILVHLTVYQWITRLDDARIGNVTGKIIALVSLALWFGVASAGRAIAFVS